MTQFLDEKGQFKDESRETILEAADNMQRELEQAAKAILDEQNIMAEIQNARGPVAISKLHESETLMRAYQLQGVKPDRYDPGPAKRTITHL